MPVFNTPSNSASVQRAEHFELHHVLIVKHDIISLWSVPGFLLSIWRLALALL
jgi:hypothetical protein